MATYLQGVTDVIPAVQPWQPNFNFYQGMMERKQSKYDRGWQQGNNIYNSVLNSPMMREGNLAKRDKFFEDIDHQIKQIGGVDLSLQQNQTAANDIFKPFYEDNNIIKDIGFTNQYHSELRNAEQLRNCLDKEKCGNKYWSGGVRAMQHKAQEFRDASDEQALQMNAPKFVNYVNVMEKATKAAKEAGLSVEYEEKVGGYLVKTKNGPALAQPLMSYFMSRFGDDPEVQEYFGTKAYLLRKENPEAAINAYEAAMMRSQSRTDQEYNAQVQDKSNRLSLEKAKGTIARVQQNTQSEFDEIVLGKKILEKQIETEGIIKDGPKDQAFRKLVTDGNALGAAKSNIDEIAGMTNAVQYVDENGNQVAPHVIDGVVGSAMMMREMNMAANTLAYQDYSVTKKADPYALAANRHSLALQRQQITHRNNMEKASFKNTMAEGAAHRKMLIQKGYINPLTGMPRYVDPSTQTMEVLPGGGMGTGDPADIAALIKQQVDAGQVPMSQAQAQSYFKKAQQLNDPESNATPDFYEPKAYTPSFNIKDFFKKTNIAPGANIATPTPTIGTTSEGDLNANYSTTINTKPDVRVPKVIENFRNGIVSATDIKSTVDDVVTDVGSIIEGYRNQVGNHREKFVTNRIEEWLNIAADAKHENHDIGLGTMYHIGNMIQHTEGKTPSTLLGPYVGKKRVKTPSNMMERLYPKYEDGTPASAEDAGQFRMDELTGGTASEFRDWPSAKYNKNLKSGFFTEQLKRDPKEIIAAAGGVDNLYDLFVDGGAPQYVMKSFDDATSMINTRDVDIISRDDYQTLTNRDADISRFKQISDNIQRGATYPEGDPDLAWYTHNSDGFSKLNDQELDAIKKYEYYTTQPTMPKATNQMGLNTVVESLQNMNAEDLTEIDRMRWVKRDADMMESKFQNQMEQAMGSFYRPKQAGNADSYARNFLAKHIWSPERNGGLGGLRTTDAIYNDFTQDVNNLRSTSKIWKARFKGAHSVDTFNKTALELESEFANGRQIFDNKSIKRMLANSHLILNDNPGFSYDAKYRKLPFTINENKLKRSNGQLSENSTYQVSPWARLLSDKDTKVVRQGKYAYVSNPYQMGKYKHKIDLSKVKLTRGYEMNMNDLKEQVGPIRASFMDHAQQTPKNNLVLPSQHMGDAGVGGNFAFSSGSLTNLKVEAGVHNQALGESIQLVKELERNYSDRTDFTGHGNPDFLKLISSTFGDDKITWAPGDKNRPGFTMNVDYTYGKYNNSRVTIELNPATAHKLLKSKGMATYDSTKQEWNYHDTKGNEMKLKQSYFVHNSQSDLIQKSKPNPYRSLIGFSDGEGYTSDTFWESMGAKVRYQKQGDQVAITLIAKYWNAEQKKFVEMPGKPILVPLHGTDWEKQIDMMNDQVFQTPGINEQLMQNEERVYDPNQFQNR